MQKIEKIYLSIKDKIISKLGEFSQLWEKGSDADIFAELVFCILTPQSRAKSCWMCVERLRTEISWGCCGVNKQDISKILAKVGVRFHNRKTEYIIKAERQFCNNGKLSIKSHINQFKNVYDAREWLVQNIKGIGYKEASHFLRNIGLGKNFAILDRHILKNLKSFEIIGEISSSLSKRRYFEIEKRMKRFAGDIKIPMSHLDFVMWYKETGEIFK